MPEDWKRLRQTYHDVIRYALSAGVSEDVLRRCTYRKFHDAALNLRLPGCACINGRWYGRSGMEAEMAAKVGLASPVSIAA